MSKLTSAGLRKLVRDAVAIRGRAILEPAGGAADKVFPPTHSVDKRDERTPGAKYAFEIRRIDGREVECVLLDSVQSQANRIEEALQALWRDQRLALPVIAVDFRAVPDVGTVTSLTAPHRVADALLRDSLFGKTLFRMSDLGKSFADATPRNAAPMFAVCPTGLVFGIWDSTGPRGGLGSKFARALTSEIVGIGAARGVKTESRIDPAGIVTNAAVIYIDAQDPTTWTHLEADAKREGQGKAATPMKWGKKDRAGKPSGINHSNVSPTIDAAGGGVTVDRVEHVIVLSLAGLRKLSFGDVEADVAARTVLAALGLVGVLAATDRGHDLRSRCLLVPRKGHALGLEAVAKDGSSETIELDLDGALTMYEGAVKELPSALAWKLSPGEPIATLKPSEKLFHLVKESRKLAGAGEADEEA